MRNQTALLPLASAFMAILFLFACQKEFKPNVPEQTLSSKDPKALSSSIKVWHGVRTPGTAPAPRGSSLHLAPSSEPVMAFAGRYAIIQPEILSGDVLGYYVSLNGAPEYFKVDYTKPRNINGKQKPKKQAGTTFRTRGVDSTGNMDSAIVIVLPANIKVPDTFCVTYWAYDNQGNVSPGISQCIYVSSLGGDAGSGWIHGSWKMTATWDAFGNKDTIVYNRMMADSDPYYCYYDSLSGRSFVSFGANGTPALGADSILYHKANLSFAVNGAQEYEEDAEGRYVDLNASTCSQLSFVQYRFNDAMTGGWNFNSATNRLTIIFENDDSGIVVVEAWQFGVIRETSTNFIIIDDTDPTDPYFIRMQKN